MKKIVLFCSAGMSTSLLVSRMKEAAKAMGYDADIEAYSLNEVGNRGPEADCVLLGPQVRFALNKTKDALPGKPIDVIDMKAYGMVDGKAAIEQAKKMMGD